ncbi:MAG: hypothetical protein QT02_C0002G0002 [archaeon GW2011_AR9]|nr:MAG: hypothetical protein QT02_C0002G0002 [archaeon GW2011_AR9]MBS3120529.1 hypothetical protein [Candidatus Woesearchaeota archaeon]HIG93968.1 hypothetical protein [Candidatus Woesearchaeota archaeon]HIH12181.1 hypothetical protein [Candidatus Woesearchaeota archaeon]
MTLATLLQRLTRPAILGLALAVSPIYACGGEEKTNNYYGGVKGGSDSNEQLCRDSCEGVAGCCRREGEDFSDYCENGGSYFDRLNCVADCKGYIQEGSETKDSVQESINLYKFGCCYIESINSNGQGGLRCKDNEPK